LSNRKGQMNSIDLMMAILIFVILIVFVIGFWFVEQKEIQSTLTKNRLEAEAISISDILIKSPGIPSDWEKNQSEIKMLGLAIEGNVLSDAKISNFTNMSYSSAQNYLGLDDQFYFYIENMNGNRLYQFGNNTFGDQVIVITRFAVLNGEKILMRVSVYE